MLSLLLFSYSSCTDQGCIEADDFGEYEQQILTIPANALGESCDYHPDQPLDSVDQGAGLKVCFTSGTIQIVDEQGISHSSPTGCSGFDDSVTKNICVEQCRQSCINQNSADSSGAEPDWVATSPKQSGQNIGVSITPGSEIYIRAIGSVVLGGDKSKPIFTRSTENSLQSKQNDFSGSFVDLKAGVSKDVKFSGRWANGSSNFGGDINSTTPSEKSAAFNGARRLVAYVIPAPGGYGFDTSATSEFAGTRGTPLFADDRLWACSYINAELKQSSCQSLPYNAANGYANTNDTIAQTYYKISSAEKSANLGKIGGMIRFVNDGLEALSVDPFAISGTVCNPTCSPLPSGVVGGMVGDLNSSTPASIQNNQTYAVRVLLKNLGSGTNSDNCSLGTAVGTSALSATISYVDANGNNATLPAQNIATNKISWSTNDIILEPGDTLTFANNSASFGGANCGQVTAYRLNKLQDIVIEKSGFVSFTRLATSGSSGNCTLNGRIINPAGSRIDDPSNDFDNDFYEYDSFAITNSIDPISNLSVPISNSTISSTPFNKTWSSKVFVRKGQMIRLDPSSWNGSWVTGSGGTRQCGIGMAMKVGGIDMTTGKIDERPALLCKGVATDQIPNPLCKLGADGTCQEYSEDCNYDPITRAPKNPDKFCPIESCQENFTCTSSGSSCSCDSSNPLVTFATCNACKAAKFAAGNQPTKIPLTLDQCYDLENYKGKVSNIPSATGFTIEQLSDAGIAKGAKKLATFNGSYGNFENFNDTGTTESTTYSNNKIYHLSQQLYSEVDGRLLFLLIDNNSFDQNLLTAYDNNGGSGSSYNGLNGYKIDLSGQQEFKNGQWLEAILCQEIDGGNSCSSFEMPTQVDGQPNIIKVLDPDTAGNDPQVVSYYQFDPYGSILRINNPNATGYDPDSNSLSLTTQGDNFYRHSYDGTSNAINADNSDSAKSKRLSNLRISFKIKDSDVPNCDVDNPVLGQTSCSSDNCGVVVENRFYDSSTIGNVNQICGADTRIGTGTTDCKKQFFCANKYYNNSGQYQVVVKVENKNANISDIVNQVVSPVIEIMDGKADGSTIGQAERVYKQIVGDARFQAIVQLMVILMITFYGVGYLMGVSEFSQGEIVSRIIKIGVIYLFISPQGWEWFDKFFVNFFKHGTDYVTFLMASAFDRSAELKTAIASNDFYDKSILFSGIDRVFGMFFSSAVQKKISALLFASIFGPVYLYIIYLSFFLYVYAVANAVLLYLTAQVFISILFVLGPLFFIMLLFNQTKDMFDKWLSELIGFSLQQIFLLTTLAFFNMMMFEIIKMALGYRICWDDVWVINIYITRIKLLSFWTIASMPSRLSLQSDIGNIGNPEGIPSLFSILFIYVIASLMHKFIDFMTNLGASIGGSLKATAMGAGIKAAGNAAMKNAKKIYQDGFDGKGGIGSKIDGATQSVDRALFDSGKKADKDRKDKKDQANKDRTNRSALSKAGDDAIKAFKDNPANALALKNASPEEQNKMLQAHRNQKMKEKGEELGLDGKTIKRLMEQKASFGGDDLLDAAKNAWKDRDIRNKNLAEKDANVKLSGSQLRNAMKAAKPEQKAELAKAANEGELQVKVGLKDKAKQSWDNQSYGKAAVQGLGAGVAAVASPVAKVAAAPFKAAKAAAKAGVQKMKEVAGKSSYDKARDDLVEKGEIGDSKYGTGWAASKEDKAKIRGRMKERSAEKSIQSTKVSKETANFVARETGGTAVSRLDRNSEYQSKLKEELTSAQETIDSGGSSDEMKNAQAKVKKLEKVLKNVDKKVNKLSAQNNPGESESDDE